MTLWQSKQESLAALALPASSGSSATVSPSSLIAFKVKYPESAIPSPLILPIMNQLLPVDSMPGFGTAGKMITGGCGALNRGRAMAG
jgi:hypothetical protein